MSYRKDKKVRIKKWRKCIGLIALFGIILQGEIEIQAEENQDENIVVSFLGDSITTYNGYTEYEERANYYSDVLMPVESTWWKRILNANEWELGVNESLGGSRVSWDGMTEDDLHFDGEDYYMASDIRIKNLGKNGEPDKIFIFGGMNDILAQEDVNIGRVKKEYVYGKVDDFADAYYTMICKIEEIYPDAEIVCLVPYHTIYSFDFEAIKQNTEKVAEIIQDVCSKKVLKLSIYEVLI